MHNGQHVNRSHIHINSNLTITCGNIERKFLLRKIKVESGIVWNYLT